MQRIVDCLESFLFVIIVDISAFLKEKPGMLFLIVWILEDIHSVGRLSFDPSTNFAMMQWHHLRIAIIRCWMNNNDFSFPWIWFLKIVCHGEIEGYASRSDPTGTHCMKART
jgi:hypothetical protein